MKGIEQRLLVGVTCCLAVFSALAHAGVGDWPEPRQNPQLTGVQPLPGRMTTAPAIIARYDLGRSRPNITAVAQPDGGGYVGLCIVAGALHGYDTEGNLLWRSHLAGLNFTAIQSGGDFNRDGIIEVALQAGRPAEPYGAAVLVSAKDGRPLWRYDVEPMSYAWYLYVGDYLPESNTDEIIVLMTGYPPDKDNGYMALFEFTSEGEAPVQKWRYDFSDYTCFPSLLQTDLDADGRKELVVETHSRMWFLDAPTGQVKHFVKWDVSPANVRSYGHVEFVDLNADGREDFLCIANFAQHHEVLLNQDGRMELAWVHGWPESVTTGKVASTWPEPPYADLDGNGKFEIVVSMFNSENEGAWLIRAYDALTGELKYRLPGMIAVTAADLDGDGKAEILANASNDPTRTVLGGARLLRVANGVFQPVWSDDTAAAIQPKAGAPLRVERGEAKYVLEWEGGAVVCRPWMKPEKPGKTDFASAPAVQGPPFPTLLAGDVLGDAKNEILIYAEPDVTVLEWTGADLNAVARYRSTSIPVVADLDGDAKAEVVVSDVRPDARPVVEALTPALDNKTLWRSAFPPSERAGLPQPRKAYIRTGRFTGKPRPDLYVWAGTPLVRSVVLEGRTGALLWERGEVPNQERYWGPSMNLASVCDYDGDGNEDLVFTNPDYYCVASGTTGDLLLGPLFPPQIFTQPSQGLYTCPVILSAPDAAPTVCLVDGHYFQGVMSLRAEPRWYAVPTAGDSRCAAEGFLRLPDGRWAMGYGRQNGRFACVNVEDGSLRWEMPLEASSSDVATCDVDGDGTPEFVFGTSHGTLYAVGDGGDAPRVVWTLNLDVGLGAPIIADINGDDASEVIVPTTDGFVCVLGMTPSEAGTNDKQSAE